MSASDEPRTLPAWLPAAGVALALVGLVALSFAERWSMLTESPFPVGVDGYFYPLQLRSLLETGELSSPATPLAFWLMAPLAAATDPITGAKLGAALFTALVALPAYGVGARLGRCRGAGLVAAAMATMSAGSAFLTIEFVKNGVGMTALLFALWLLLRALESPTRLRIALAIAGAVLALLTHKMAGALLVVFAVPAIISAAASRGRLRGRRLLYVLALVFGATVLVAVLGLAFPRQLPSPDAIDLRRVLFADELHLDAPAMVTRTVRLTFGHEALLAAIAGAIGAIVLSRRGRHVLATTALPASILGEPLRKSRPGETIVAWIVVIFAIALAWPWLEVTDPQGLGVRLRIVAFVPLALASAVIAGALLGRVKHRDLVLAAVALALAARSPGHRDEGRIQAHPAMVAAIHALASEVPQTDTIVVPERHIVFMVAWYTRANVRIRPESVAPEHRWRLVPLAWIGLGSPMDKAIRAARDNPAITPPLGLHPRHPNGLVLMREATYQAVLSSLPPDVRKQWARWRTI